MVKKTGVSAVHFSSLRRQFLKRVGATGLLTGLQLVPSLLYARSKLKKNGTLYGKVFNLTIGYTAVNFSGAERVATTVNGSVPGPTLFWQEGDEVTVHVILWTSAGRCYQATSLNCTRSCTDANREDIRSVLRQLKRRVA